jgi:lysophospholipase L1-like esterase
MTRLRNTLTAALLAGMAFVYGVGVGYYRWPPFGTIRAVVQAARGGAPEPEKSAYYEARAAQFRELSGRPEIVMLGDSLTESGNWHELVPEFRVINRGIAGDTSSGVLDRLEEVIARRPKLVFLMIGTNDIGLGVPPETLLRNLREIGARLRGAAIPTVAQSILFRGGWLQADNAAIAAVNAEWAAFCAAQGVRFLDLNALMAVNNRLPDTMTYDGVHLTAAAYRVWRDAVVHAAAEILS